MYQLKLLSQMDTMDGLSFSTSDSRLEQKFLPYFAICFYQIPVCIATEKFA